MGERESPDEGLIVGEKGYKESKRDKWEADEEKGVDLNPGEEPKLLQTTGTLVWVFIFQPFFF